MVQIIGLRYVKTYAITWGPCAQGLCHHFKITTLWRVLKLSFEANIENYFLLIEYFYGQKFKSEMLFQNEDQWSTHEHQSRLITWGQ